MKPGDFRRQLPELAEGRCAFSGAWSPLSGRFLIRLSDSLFLAPQSDLEKKQHTARKSSARNAQIRRLFASTPKAEDFLATQERQSGQFGLRMKVSARIKPVLCVFGKLVC
jgi:hypothetical protein